MLVEGCGDGLAVRSKRGMNLELGDRSTGAVGEGMLELLDRRLLDDGAKLYSLIDGAKFSRLNRLVSPQDKSIELYSLLGEAAVADAVYAGPILILHKARENCTLLAKLLDEYNSAGFISLIVSAENLADLVKRLVWLTEVRHEDGTEWVMRYYDPTILPHWLDVLDVEQRTSALSGTLQWLFKNVRGTNQAVDFGIFGSAKILDSRPMLLSDGQCDDLMALAMPYIVMSQLSNDNPKVLDKIPKNERYDFFYRQIEVARGLKVISAVDIKTFCILAVMFGPEFSTHPSIIKAAESSNADISFSEKVMEWSAEQWELIEADMLLLS
jgi:hypothetical protein